MVYRLQLTFVEILETLDIKYIPTKRSGYFQVPGIYDITDIDSMLKLFLFINVKMFITIVDIRLKSILKNIQTSIFTKKSFFYTIFCFT